jgi:hypothetical protein
MNADGSDQIRLTNDWGIDWAPAWSPDGTKITFIRGFLASSEIYLMNADGSNQTRLTTDRFFDAGPAWSPDGSRLAFSSGRDGNLEIYVMDADGTGQIRLTTDPGPDSAPAWSPDGTKIAFTDRFGSRAAIYVMNADGSGRTSLTNNAAADYDPSWQPLALDRTPPVLTLPGNLAVDATGPAGALVNYSVAARDDRDPGPVLTCTPPSGSTFAIRDTTVTCTATDASGNSSTATFTIHVRNATEQLLELQTVIEGYQLKRGLGSDLSRYLKLAVKYIGRGQPAHACQQLDQFLETVERAASKTPPRLSSDQATTLTEGGRRIRAVLGC